VGRLDEVVVKRVILIALIAACTRGEHRDARARYNEGLSLYQKGDFDAAEKSLLEARSNAGVDPELRFRAAYDLGMTYAAHADKVKNDKDHDLAKALELEQQAVSWFSDATKLRNDADAKANLATVRARAQAMSDELRKGEKKLEARLDKLIDSQRKVVEGARGAWVQIKQAGGADPLAQQSALTALADEERGIVAEAGVIGDMADDEIDTIGKRPRTSALTRRRRASSSSRTSTSISPTAAPGSPRHAASCRISPPRMRSTAPTPR
jgi:tetratricopeptide (TPR) repeat protein